MSEHNDEPLLMDMLDACRAVNTYVKGLPPGVNVEISGIAVK